MPADVPKLIQNGSHHNTKKSTGTEVGTTEDTFRVAAYFQGEPGPMSSQIKLGGLFAGRL